MAVLPLPMHAIYASKHTGKPPLLVDGKESMSVLHIGLSQVLFTEDQNDSSTKIIH
jgi:hypothetical protein